MNLQSTLVQKLETKLQEAENAIQSHLTSRGGPERGVRDRERDRDRAGGSHPSSDSPQSSPRTKYQLEREYNSKRYHPTPKPAKGRSRLRWNDGYVDQGGGEEGDEGLFSSAGAARATSGRRHGDPRYEEEEEYDDETTRFGDLTFEEREVSDEDEEILSRNPSLRSRPKQRPSHSKRSMNQRWVLPSSNSSSIQVVSILKEVLLNLMNRETLSTTVSTDLSTYFLTTVFASFSLCLSVSLSLSFTRREDRKILNYGKLNYLVRRKFSWSAAR
jgi:hypothetical protein